MSSEQARPESTVKRAHLTQQKNCIITDERVTISGTPHWKVVRADGVTVYLDEVFCDALKTFTAPDRNELLCQRYGLTVEESTLIYTALDKAHLIISTAS